VRRAGCRRGMTLVEMLVVTAVGVAVLGMILGVFIETNRSTDRTISRQQGLQEAMTRGQAVERMIRFRVRSEDLAPAFAATVTTGALVEKMSRGELRLVSLARGTDDGTPFWAATNSGDGPQRTVRVGASATPGDPRDVPAAGAGAIPSVIEFHYGNQGADGTVKWSDEGTTDTCLVRLRVSAFPPGASQTPAIYETVVPLP